MANEFLLLITFDNVDRRLLKAELDNVNLMGSYLI